jgi:hypothetical protein
MTIRLWTLAVYLVILYLAIRYGAGQRDPADLS